jgi:ABC-type phosphate transport system auxiliary subunit
MEFVDKEITKVRQEIHATEKEIPMLQLKIQKIELEVDEVVQEINDVKRASMSEDMRQLDLVRLTEREKQLRNDKQAWHVEKQALRNEKAALRKKEEDLLHLSIAMTNKNNCELTTFCVLI